MTLRSPQKTFPVGTQEDDAPEKDDGDKPIASVQRALLILDAFLDAESTLTLAELAERTGLAKSTILRITATLEQSDYLVRTSSGEFHVGPKPLQLANRFQSAVQPEDVVVPILRELTDKTKESASYVVRKDQSRITLYRVNSPHMIRDHGMPGDIVPLDRGAVGHVLLAFSPTPGRHQALRQELIAITRGEIHPGMTGLAAPVFNANRECLSAVALTGPDTRFTPEAVKKMEAELLNAARTITLRLGGNGRLFDDALAARR